MSLQSRRIYKMLLEDFVPPEKLKKIVQRARVLAGVEKKAKKLHSAHVEDVIKSRIAQDKGAMMDAMGFQYRHATPSSQTNWPTSMHPDMQRLMRYKGRPQPISPLEAPIQPHVPISFRAPVEGAPYEESFRRAVGARAERAQAGHPEWYVKKRYPFPFDEEEARHTVTNLKPVPSREKVKRPKLGMRKPRVPIVRPKGKMTGEQWQALSKRVIDREITMEQAASEAYQYAPPVERAMASIEYPKESLGKKFIRMKNENLPYENAISRYAELKNLETPGLRTRSRPPVDRFYMEQGKPVYERQYFKNISAAGDTVAEQVTSLKGSHVAKTSEKIIQGDSDLARVGATAELLWKQNIRRKDSYDYGVWKRLLSQYQSRGKTKDVKTYFNERVALYLLDKEKLLKTRTGKIEVRLIEGYLKDMKEIMK